MRDLYSRLEVEYDALTSDESILESLHANDMLDEIIDELENEYA
jgi:arginyl-tRNA synthetase